MLDITPTFREIALFVIFNVLKMFHAKSIVTLVVYLHTILRMPYSLLIAIKQNDK
jgi:hypothetical protein